MKGLPIKRFWKTRFMLVDILLSRTRHLDFKSLKSRCLCCKNEMCKKEKRTISRYPSPANLKQPTKEIDNRDYLFFLFYLINKSSLYLGSVHI